MTESEAKGIGLLINQLARQERELAAARAEVERCHLHAPNRERELEKTLADLDDTRALLSECRKALEKYGTHQRPCPIYPCSCGLRQNRDDLLQRIDAALGEER